jgi:hypothetical protein
MNVKCPHCQEEVSLEQRQSGQMFSCCFCRGTFTVDIPQAAASLPNFHEALEECRRAAIDAGALDPQGLLEGASANWLSANGQSFADTALARGRLEASIRECMRRKGFSV